MSTQRSALVEEPAYLSHPLFQAGHDHVEIVVGEGNGLEYPVPVPSPRRIAACCKLIRAENAGKKRSVMKFGLPRYEVDDEEPDYD